MTTATLTRVRAWAPNLRESVDGFTDDNRRLMVDTAALVGLSVLARGNRRILRDPAGTWCEQRPDGSIVPVQREESGGRELHVLQACWRWQFEYPAPIESLRLVISVPSPIPAPRCPVEVPGNPRLHVA